MKFYKQAVWMVIALMISVSASGQPAVPSSNATTSALREIAGAIDRTHERSNSAAVNFLKDWKDYLIPFLGLPFGVALALLGASLNRRNQRRQALEEQKSLLRALRGELAAVLYHLYYLSENIESNEVHGSYRVLEGASHRSFPLTMPVYASNAGRVGSLTGRAYGMLANYYVKCRESAARFEYDLGKHVVAKPRRDALFIEAGHGALIAIAFEEFRDGNLDLKLTAIPDDRFDQFCSNWRSKEAIFLREGRALWLQMMKS